MFLPEVKSKIGEDISILIKVDNYPYNFICECGDASNLTVKECQNTEAIFISHTHIDHFINFDTILRHQIGIGRKVIICGPKGITEQVQSKIKGYQWNLISEDAITYEVREIIDKNKIHISELRPPFWNIEKTYNNNSTKVFQNKNFEVDFVILDHKTDSIAYRFKESDTIKINIGKSPYKGGSWVRALKTAYDNDQKNTLIEVEDQSIKAEDLFYLLEIKKGDTLGVIMDHAAHADNHEKIKSLFQDCNQVFIESFYKAEDKAFAEANYHSYSEESARIMKLCHVGKATPVHFSRKYTIEDIEILLEEFYKKLK